MKGSLHITVAKGSQGSHIPALQKTESKNSSPDLTKGICILMQVATSC